MNNNKFIFSLDIGTRSVVGMLGVLKDGIFNILDYEVEFHNKRAMRDGQIEDIDLVAEIVMKVKTRLEERSGQKLKEVAIAAAGRSLKTEIGTFTQKVLENEPITEKLIHFLEYSAIENARHKFVDENESAASTNNYYCVGYSVSNYLLDNYKIKNLLGQKGSEISVDVIAAFLPATVLTSLYAVTSKCGLEVSNITLEPIAAMHAVVPEDTRFLNLAIVDIGGGTSDIAISKDGSIIGYDMITNAGDEITEKIMEKYLVSFATAEKIKLQLNKDDEIEFTDILGFKNTLNPYDCLESINNAVEKLAKDISNSILSLNGSTPTAVFLVGGGSQIPKLNNLVAENLELPKNRVAIGIVSQENNVSINTEELLNPLFVTPIGIGILSSIYTGCDFFSIKVNGQKLMLFNNQNMKVIDALMLSNIKPSSLVNISSPSLIYKLNGKEKILKGTFGKTGSIIINGKEGTVDTPVKQGDVLTINKAEKGLPPILTMQEVIDNFKLENENKNIYEISYNGTILNPDKIDFNNWKISYQSDIIIKTEPEYIDVEINKNFNEHTTITHTTLNEIINPLGNNESKENLSENKSITVTINDQKVTLNTSTNEPLLMMHLLKYIDLDEPKDSQSKFIIKLNGSESKYADAIKDGDVAEIKWAK